MKHPRPSTSFIKGNKKRKVTFQTAWLEHEDFKNWLTQHSDNGKAYCTACDKILACGKVNLSRHANRASHIENLNLKRGNPSASLLASPVQNRDHINKVKSAEIKLATFYAKHNIALQTIDHLVLLLKDICSDPQVVNDLILSQTKCAQIIKNVVKAEDENTVENLKHQKFSV